MMVREITMAGYNQTTAPATITAVSRCTGTTTASNCAGITNAAAKTISFTADINGDGDITDSNENITYFLDTSDGALKRKSTLSAQEQPVVENVQSLGFVYYYDGTIAPIIPNNLINIRRVKITIVTRTAKEDPNYTDATYGGHYRYYTLSSFAFPRNLALGN